MLLGGVPVADLPYLELSTFLKVNKVFEGQQRKNKNGLFRINYQLSPFCAPKFFLSKPSPSFASGKWALLNLACRTVHLLNSGGASHVAISCDLHFMTSVLMNHFLLLFCLYELTDRFSYHIDISSNAEYSPLMRGSPECWTSSRSSTPVSWLVARF